MKKKLIELTDMGHYPDKLLAMVNSSVKEFFTSIGFSETKELPAAGADDAQNEIYSASLGFSGALIRGAIVILAPSALLAATNPQRSYAAPLKETDHADWIGEIANQIVGALKRQTAGYNVDFLLSTPTMIKGRELSLSQPTNTQVAIFRYDISGHGRLGLHFNATLDEGLKFEGDPVSNAQASGGDLLLF